VAENASTQCGGVFAANKFVKPHIFLSFTRSKSRGNIVCKVLKKVWRCSMRINNWSIGDDSPELREVTQLYKFRVACRQT
jgi:hypothetical protein